MLVKLTLFRLPRLTKSCGLTDKCANDLTAKEKNRVTCKSHADFKYVRNSSIQDKLIILHVKQINLVIVWV